MLVKDRKYLIGLKVLATIALCCTIVLWCGLWIGSCVPVSQSQENTQHVTDKLDSKYDLTTKFNGKVVTQSVKLSHSTDIFYTGQTEQLEAEFIPSNTLDKDVEFISDTPSVATVDQNGVVTYKNYGWAQITVRLKSNPSVSDFVSVTSYGKHPNDVKQPSIEFPTASESGFLVGTTHKPTLNNGQTYYIAATFKSSNKDVATVVDGYVSGVSEGTATITATYKSTGKSVSTTVTVLKNPDFVKPTDIVFKQNPTLYIGDNNTNLHDIVESVEPMGAKRQYAFSVKTDDKSILSFKYQQFIPHKTGQVRLTYTSIFNPSLSKDVVVTVAKIPPVSLSIAGPDVVSANYSSLYYAKHSPQAYPKDVKWEIVTGKATITKNGRLTAGRLGTVTIRATSTIDPTIWQEKTVQVKLFASPYVMVRKFLGHGGLSALLGLGIFGTLFLLCRRKWLCFPLTPLLSFVYAGISESIQHFTPGRVCSIFDIFTDFIGSLVGMAIAVVLVVIVLTVWYLANKKSFRTLAYAYKNLCFGNLFKKTYRFDAEYARDARENTIENDIAINEVACNKTD